MSRKLLFTFIALTIVASTLIAASVPTKKEPVYISARSGEVTLGPKQSAIVRSGWGACSTGMIQDFKDHYAIKLELYQNDILLQTVTTDQGYWTESVAFAPNSSCLHVNEPQQAFWQFEDLDLKEPGTYTLWFFRDWTVPLGDGFDINGDGYMDIYPPGMFEPQQVTINVLP